MNSAFVTKTTFAVGLTLTVGTLSPVMAQSEVALDHHAVAFITNRVDAGEATFSEARRTARTGVIKLGEGTMTIKNDDVAALRVQAREGKVALADDGIEFVDTLSDAVKSKLALWVSVKDTNADHIVYSNGNEIATWYDVRETDIASPKYLRLQAWLQEDASKSGARGPLVEEVKYIRKYDTETNTQTMAYFRGYGYGSSMRFLTPNGGAYGTRPIETSIVYGYTHTGNVFGHTFGNCKSTGENVLWTEKNGLPWNGAWATARGNTRLWIDGEIFKRDQDHLPYGFHTYHIRYNTLAMDYENLNSFENSLFSYYTKDNGERRGGEHLGEVMFFTNMLSYAERVEVQRYLDRKWFNRRPKTSVVTLESGAELDVASGDDANVEVAGNGSFVKKNDGTYLYQPKAFNTESPAAVTIEGGTVEAARLIAVKANPGDSINVQGVGKSSTMIGAVNISVGAAANTSTLAKTGRGTATIGAIPEGTAKLDVQAGTLSLRPSKVVRRYEVAIPNGDFSEWAAGTETKGNTYNMPKWDRHNTTCCFCNFDRWLTDKGDLQATAVAYGVSGCPPPEGRNMLFMKMLNAKTSVAGVVLEPGEYELTYLMTSRQSAAKGLRVKNYLTDASGNEIYIGTATANTIANWDNSQKTFRFSVANSGSYTLFFQMLPNWFGAEGTTSGRDVMTLINSLHLYRIGDKSVAWKIPNGDFEAIYTNGVDTIAYNGGIDSYGEIGYLDGKVYLPNWTFDTELSGDYAKSAVTSGRSYSMGGRRWGSGYDGSLSPLGGTKQGLFRTSGATMVTTFTPPAGTWFLKVQSAPWTDYSGSPSISASIQPASGDAIDLGKAYIKNQYVMNPYLWPTNFTADGTTAYTLTLTMNGGTGAHVDDFELVGEYECEDNLVQNGDFELPWTGSKENVSDRTGWSNVSSVIKDAEGKDKTGGSCCPRIYGRNDLDAFGIDHGSGDYFLEPYSSGGFGGVYQDIKFPQAGYYRLDYLAKNRLGWGNALMVAYAALIDTETSTTNIIDQIRTLGGGAYSERSGLFYVDKACTRRLQFMISSGAYLCLDDVSIRYVGANGEGAFSAPDTSAKRFMVNIANGTYLHLDFSGNVNVTRLTVDGVIKPAGTYSAANCQQIVGPGTLTVAPLTTGTQIWVK